MNNVINKLRELDGSEGYEWSDIREEIDEILDIYNPEGYTVKKVYSGFEEGGRWYNVESTVYQVEQNGETVFFEFVTDVPASEVQEGMDLSWSFYEVEPKEVIVIKYVAKGSK